MPKKAAPERVSVAITYESDRHLRKLIGEDTKLSEIFTPKRIAACEKAINNGRSSFFVIAEQDLAKLETLLHGASSNDSRSDHLFDDIAGCAANIRGHADLFGFSVLSTISDHICGYCAQSNRATQKRFQLIIHLAKMLHIAIKDKVTDQDDVLVRELNDNFKNFSLD